MIEQTHAIILSFTALTLFQIYKILGHHRQNNLVKQYFHDKVVLITGASTGLGAALAQQLYKLNCRIILCSRREEELNKVKENLISSTRKPLKEPHVLVLDVCDSFEVMKEKLDDIVDTYGCIDVLINNAGLTYRGIAYETIDEVFHKIMNVNFYGPLKLTRLVLSYAMQQNLKNVEKNELHEYAIVNVGSVSSVISAPFRSAYSSSKFALSAYTDALRAELFNYPNIRLLNAYPGYINTNILLNALKENGETISQNDASHQQGYSAKYVAKEIIDAIVADKKEVVITTFLQGLIVKMRFLFPNVYHLIARKIAKKTYSTRYG